MNRIEILKFIVDNKDNERLVDYYNKSYEKLKDLNKRIDKLSLYLIIVVPTWQANPTKDKYDPNWKPPVAPSATPQKPATPKPNGSN